MPEQWYSHNDGVTSHVRTCTSTEAEEFVGIGYRQYYKMYMGNQNFTFLWENWP